ncbi:MAG TPA: MarR family transcriptional regulator [Janthinobacterium sp.]|jgi:DNA-binding MarR family transcriptional regulator|nr:MarR family transcriptional regulator [Janthinobacterium sp.]
MKKKTAAAQPIAAAVADQAALEQAQRLAVLKKLRIVVRSAQRHSNWIEKQCGVSGAQLWIMQELHTAPGLKVGEIAARLAIHQTTTSNLLDELQKKAYVIKERDSQDQRVVRLTLAESGRLLLERAPKPAQGLLPGALMRMSGLPLQTLDDGLQCLLDSIDVLDEEHGMLPLPFTM